MERADTRLRWLVRWTALCLALVVLLCNVLFLIFDLPFYYGEFAKHEVYANFASPADAKAGAAQLVGYFSSAGVGEPDIALFLEDERSHLRDVKLLIVKMKWLLYAALAGMIAGAGLLWIRSPKRGIVRMSRVLILSGAWCMALIAGLIVLGLNFDWLFVRFHLVFFPQGNWAFSAESGLIRMFPQMFFYDCFVAIAIRVFVLGAMCLIVGLWLKRRARGSPGYTRSI